MAGRRGPVHGVAHFQIILNEIMKAKKGRPTIRPSGLSFRPKERETNRLSQIFLMRVIIIMKQVLHTDELSRGKSLALPGSGCTEGKEVYRKLMEKMG